MLSKRIVIKNAENFDVKLATTMVDKLAEFDSNFIIVHQNHTVDPKSIISLLSMSLTDNDYIDISIEGNDALLMCNEFEQLLKNAEVI